MFTEISVSDEIKRLVADVINKTNFEPTRDIKYYTGSQVGDGFGSKTIAVVAINNGKSLNLFLKCALNAKDPEKVKLNRSYTNEIYFYKTIYPTYMKFLKDRGVKDGFRNAPKYYSSTTEIFKEIIVLENLRGSGYTLFKKYKFMDDAHLTLFLKTFAKFHAVSFAFKDQMREAHDQMCENCHDISEEMEDMGFYKLLTDMTKDFLAKLDPIEDKDILDKCGHLAEKISEYVQHGHKYVDEYSILTKGDCWSNNMMIKYEDQSEEKPTDIMLIDWQLIRRASPVHDLMNLFFSVISKEALDNTEQYLKCYHDELSRQIKQLGSDPNVVYPYHAFENEWRSMTLFGFGVAVILIKMMLTENDETPNFKGMHNGEEFNNVEDFIHIKKEQEYMTRLKYIARYFIKQNLM